jgi:uncharacterized protein YqgV (UPF0045/DUF77 family)
MRIALEISYYPLIDNFIPPIDTCIALLQHPELEVKTYMLGTLVVGEYELVMNQVKQSMHQLMLEHPSVFNIKITNASPDL